MLAICPIVNTLPSDGCVDFVCLTEFGFGKLYTNHFVSSDASAKGEKINQMWCKNECNIGISNSKL